MGIRRARKLSMVVAVMLLSLVLAACGGDSGDDASTATAPGADAPPTVEATQEASEAPEESPQDLSGTAAPTNIDMSTSPSSATPALSESEVVEPAMATAESQEAPTGTPAASPVATVAEETSTTGDPVSPLGTPEPSGEGTQADVNVGDGTTGAVLSGDEEAPAASPEPVGAATPAVASAGPEVPSGSATPAAFLEVSSCDVANVPSFTGEQSTYSLTTDVNFRTGPGAECDLALDVPLGEFQQVVVVGGPVVRTDDGSEWVQIQVGETIGWVAFEFLAPVE